MKKYAAVIFAIALITLYQNNFGQNFNDALLLSEPGIYNNARALSLGNSYTALSNDFSGVLFNPAGLGLIKNLGIYAGVNFNSFDNQTTFFGNETGSSKSGVRLNQVGIVYPLPTLRGSWVFAFGYNLTKDFNKTLEFDGYNNNNNSMIQYLTGDYNPEPPITYDLYLSYYDTSDGLDKTLINGMLNQSGKIRQEGEIGKWSFASSIEAAKDFYIGGGINIISGKYNNNRQYWEDDINNVYDENVQLDPTEPDSRDFQSFYLNDIIDWNLSGWDANIGILYNWQDRIKFGANVKLPSVFTIKETYYVNATSEFAAVIYELDPIVDKIEYEISTPYEFSFGGYVTIPSNAITLSGDIKIIDYTQMEFSGGFDEEYRIERNREIEDLFATTINAHIGGEVKIPNSPVTLRVGGMLLPSPYADDTSEFNKKYITTGIGLSFNNNFSIDLGYAYGWWKDYGDNYNTNQSRTLQDITTNSFILNVSTSLE